MIIIIILELIQMILDQKIRKKIKTGQDTTKDIKNIFTYNNFIQKIHFIYILDLNMVLIIFIGSIFDIFLIGIILYITSECGWILVVFGFWKKYIYELHTDSNDEHSLFEPINNINLYSNLEYNSNSDSDLIINEQDEIYYQKKLEELQTLHQKMTKIIIYLESKLHIFLYENENQENFIKSNMDILYTQITRTKFFCDICGIPLPEGRYRFEKINIDNTDRPIGIILLCQSCETTHLRNCYHCDKYMFIPLPYPYENIHPLYADKNICSECFIDDYIQCENCHNLYHPNDDFKDNINIYHIESKNLLFEQVCISCGFTLLYNICYGIINQYITQLSISTGKSILPVPYTPFFFELDRLPDFQHNLNQYLQKKGIQIIFEYEYDTDTQITNTFISIKYFFINSILEKIRNNCSLESYELCDLLYKYRLLYYNLITDQFPNHIPSKQIRHYLIEHSQSVSLSNSDFEILF